MKNKLINKDEVIKTITECNIRFEEHLHFLKLYDASFMRFQDQESTDNYHGQNLINAIQNCIDIKALDLSDCVNIPKTIKGFPYLNTIILPTFLDFIPRIQDCPSLNKVSIPKKGVERIESSNFENYPPIDELILDEYLRNIDAGAFGSSKIKRVDLSQCVNLEQKNIKKRAFWYSNIEEIVFPRQISILPFGAFVGCKQLKTITGSDLLATFYDENNSGFVRFDHAAYYSAYCFSGCNNIQFIQFSPSLSTEGVRQLFDRQSYNENNGEGDADLDCFYDDKRCGIVLEIDECYSYIWSFTDFAFYLAKKLDDTFNNKIVGFYNANRHKTEMKEGKCWICCNSTDHIALGVSLGCNFFFNHRFDRRGNKLGVVTIENDQEKAIKIYENQINLQAIDIKTKTSEFDSFVDGLNIETIIDSYRSIRKYNSHIRPDDYDEITVHRSASYSDSYIETLLPTQFYMTRKGFTDSNNYDLGSMTEEELQIDDEIIKKSARERYVREEHKRCLINKFIRDAVANEKFVEKCLRINEARDLLISLKNVDGNQKIVLLNSNLKR